MGTLDGPGIRTVVFMQGCLLRCRYCHNPDTFKIFTGGEKIEGGMPEVYTADELFNKVIRYREYYGKEGGVTASGGEPLLQTEFLTAFFKKLKAAGINTALDTAGSVWNDKVRELLSCTDLVILDIKHTDAAAYDELCGQKKGAGLYGKVLRFLDYCAGQKKRIWLRQVIVSGINDTMQQITELKRLCDKYKPEKVELLPYHTMGAAKWAALDLKYTLNGVEPPDGKKMESLKKILTFS